MKKYILSLFTLITFSLAVNAQSTINIGLKGGVNLSDIVGTDSHPDNSYKPGFTLGGYLELKTSDNFGIQPELFLSLQGSNTENEVLDLNQNNLYLNLPIMLKFYIPGAKGLNIQTGPQVGYLFSSKEKGEAFGKDIDNDTKDIFRKLDFAFGLGLGFDKESYKINIRYNLGLSSLGDTGDNQNKIDTQNRVIQLSVGIPIIK